MKTLTALLILIVLVALGAGAYYVYSSRQAASPPAPQTSTPTEPTVRPLTAKDTGVQQIKSAHFEDASPGHNEVFAAAPINVTVNFNFDLADNSSITVEKDGVDYGSGATTIDPNKRTMRRNLKASPDGIFIVKYTACWPDRTCHDGQHAFTIDSSQLGKYSDVTGRAEVEVEMESTAFTIPYLVISKGTKVTWHNHDPVTHYVNGDTHPFHTFLLALNSEALTEDAEFSYTFTEPGEYPYHCSAHAAQMTGRIVVK